MATSNLYSHSPQVSDASSLHRQVSAPFTPIHSPHHSVQSESSLRTPVHTLSLHEYRKQQNTPLSRIATPSGRTLRRKASTFTLNEVERVPSTKPNLRRDPQPSPRHLHSSYSAQQLAPPPSFFGVAPIADQAFRSQSAEPGAQGESISSIATVDSLKKVRNFGTRKRLPRPPAGSGLPSTSYEPLRPTQQIRASLPPPLSFLTEASNASDSQITSTPSLSRFPQPPHFETPREVQREKAISFATTAPATPPATPATIHYRGASFDLVNPHASLLYRDIVTPSRDFDSSDFLPLESGQDSYDFSEVSSTSNTNVYSPKQLQMAPKRPLYGDFTAAHAGILRRTENLSASTLSELPLPPTPAAISPGSSTYTSPVYSPESRLAPSPLAVRKAPAESRFSLKQLTRTLTQKLTKSPSHELEQEEELQQLRGSSISGLSFTADEEPIRALEQTYIPGDRTSYFPISPVSPISPTSPASLKDLGSVSGEEEEQEEEEPSVEYARSNPSRNYGAQALLSMVPDDSSTHIGHGHRQRSFASNEERGVRPYYDDLASIYASSSIYTEGSNRRSTYQENLPDTRDNSAFLYESDKTATGRGRDDSYGHLRRHSRSLSRVLAQKLHQQASTQDNGKTDTISKFIDQYDGANTTSNSLTTLRSANTTDLIAPYASDTDNEAFKAEHQSAASLPGSTRLRFDFISKNKPEDGDRAIETVQPALAREHAFAQQPGLPPTVAPPLAPAFQYQQESRALTRPEISEAFTNESYTSYGDTRNLLQIRQSEVAGRGMSAQGLQSSSSYSQPEGKALEPSSSYSQPGDRSAPLTPQEALDHAELIFDDAAAKEEPSHADIPAMWGKRGSLTLLRNKRLTDGSARTSNNEKAEWETVAGDSQQGRMSLDSIADYSSSEGSSNSLGLTAAASVASWSDQNRIRSSSFYSHPSPIRPNAHPFSSSPPRLTAAAASQTAPDVAGPERLSSPTQSSTMPVFRFSDQRRHAVEEPYAFAPWTDPYALTDKETQELLASGPNDEILFGSEADNLSRRASRKLEELEKSSSLPFIDAEPGLERENTFDKLTILGPKGNLTGSPRGTGMQEVGSSVADTSSPGAKLNSSSPRSDYDGFYASPFPAVGSITRIRQPQFPAEQQDERPGSQMTIFPSAYDLESKQASSPLAGAGGRRSFTNSTTFKPARRASRSAVPGQTKLRQMVLAPDVRSTASSKDTHFSRFISAGGSTRPSTSDTSTPLHPSHPSLFRPSRDTFPTIRSKRTTLVHQHSPHLLCPEREVKEEDEVRRQKLSWLIFACFCLLPPCMFLYRMWGDTIIVSITKGELGSCTAKSKRVALIAGIVVNIGLIAAILVPILVAQALKAI